MTRPRELLPPPPVLFAAAFAVGLQVQKRNFLLLPESVLLKALGCILLALSAALAGTAIVQFWRARTTIIPGGNASAFVVSGAFKYTRNPMYVALAALYLGATILLRFVWPLVFLPLAIWSVQYFVIRREERHLAERFGRDYVDYTHRVRRWI